jgi:hypothetical protein
LSFLLLPLFSSTKLEIRAEQVLLGSEGWGRERVGAQEEKWPKQYMHT